MNILVSSNADCFGYPDPLPVNIAGRETAASRLILNSEPVIDVREREVGGIDRPLSVGGLLDIDGVRLEIKFPDVFRSRRGGGKKSRCRDR